MCHNLEFQPRQCDVKPIYLIIIVLSYIRIYDNASMYQEQSLILYTLISRAHRYFSEYCVPLGDQWKRLFFNGSGFSFLPSSAANTAYHVHENIGIVIFLLSFALTDILNVLLPKSNTRYIVKWMFFAAVKQNGFKIRDSLIFLFRANVCTHQLHFMERQCTFSCKIEIITGQLKA